MTTWEPLTNNRGHPGPLTDNQGASENYYKDLIDDSKGNSSTLWKIIGELANLKKK